MPAEAHKKMEIAALCELLDRYINDNDHSRDVDERWLASQLVPIRDIARTVRSSVIRPPDLRRKSTNSEPLKSRKKLLRSVGRWKFLSAIYPPFILTAEQ